MPGKVTFKGSPLTLIGRPLRTGVSAPGFKVCAINLQEKTLKDFQGRVKVINAFPSLDTPVCDLQVKEFNKRAAGLSEEVIVIGISKDLPFAQARFCSLNDIKNEVVLSDYKSSSFGINYGLLIQELNLLARAVVILDKNNVVRYAQVAPEITQAVDFDKAFAALEEAVNSPQAHFAEDGCGHCRPCEGQIKPLAKEKIEKLMAQSRGWELIEDRKLAKEFKYPNFSDAKYFLDILSVVAEEEGHHPAFFLSYGKLKVILTTHAAGGLTENDFTMARIIDEIGGSR